MNPWEACRHARRWHWVGGVRIARPTADAAPNSCHNRGEVLLSPCLIVNPSNENSWSRSVEELCDLVKRVGDRSDAKATQTIGVAGRAVRSGA